MNLGKHLTSGFLYSARINSPHLLPFLWGSMLYAPTNYSLFTYSSVFAASGVLGIMIPTLLNEKAFEAHKNAIIEKLNLQKVDPKIIWKASCGVCLASSVLLSDPGAFSWLASSGFGISLFAWGIGNTEKNKYLSPFVFNLPILLGPQIFGFSLFPAPCMLYLAGVAWSLMFDLAMNQTFHRGSSIFPGFGSVSDSTLLKIMIGLLVFAVLMIISAMKNEHFAKTSKLIGYAGFLWIAFRTIFAEFNKSTYASSFSRMFPSIYVILIICIALELPARRKAIQAIYAKNYMEAQRNQHS